jgi:hypothetical protein
MPRQIIESSVLKSLLTLSCAGIAAVAAPTAGHAQWANSDVGITAGYNSATISGKDVPNPARLPGFILGISVLHPLSGMWSVQPELLYSRRGAKAPDENLQGTTDYIDLPVLAKLSFGPMATSNVRPALYLGPYAGMNLSCTIKGTQFGQKIDESCDKLPVNPFSIKKRSMDYGVIAGAGVDWNNVGVFTRYQWGMTRIAKGYDPKHRVFTVGARLSFKNR